MVLALDPRQRAKLLLCKAFGKQRKEVGHRRMMGEVCVSGIQKPIDGFRIEGVAELRFQSFCSGFQGQPLVDAHNVLRMAQGVGLSVIGLLRRENFAGWERAERSVW
jgi:hypothetical protein